MREDLELERARSRFIAAVQRSIDGARLQRDRIEAATAAAPRLLGGTEYQVINLTGVPGNDLDYYAYELARLRAITVSAINIFDRPSELVTALDAIDAAIPGLRDARNPITHPSDPRFGKIAWFSSIVRLEPNGNAATLVDPRYGHHEAAERLADSLLKFLRAGLRETGED